MKRLLHFNLKIVLSLLVVVLPFSKLFSSNLTVTAPANAVDLVNKTVTFDLSWNNSWRQPAPVTAANWDAAWVFIKWRDCSALSSTQFTHGLISTAVSDHSFNVLGGGTTFEPTASDGTGNTIDASPNNTGIMLRNLASPSSGTVSARVTLKVINLPIAGSTIDLRVYGIEMVYVPQGTYFLGDGNGTGYSYQSFANSGTVQAMTISTDAVQTVFEETNHSLLGTCNLTQNFPKGFNAFYIMKYEITQGQYVDFLNASPSLVQSIHFPNNNGTNRHTITNSTIPGTFSANNKSFRACNFLSWADFGTYLDWAALRPLTELEYEKACKGTAPVSPYDNAMGVAFSTRAVSISGAENGTETISVPGGANICAGTTAFTGSGDGGQGPLRVGIFATPTTTTRNQTGGSFYGAMELSGNVDEYYISAIAGTSGKISSGGVAPGDGILDDAAGQFNQSGWPLPLGPSTNIIHRGGNWNTASVTGGNTNTGPLAYLNVSDRQGGTSILRANTSGGRGGRGGTIVSGGTITFSYSNTIESFTVPSGVTTLTIDAFGAGGTFTNAGRGAEMKGTFTVTPGEVLKILAGGIGPTASNGGGGGTFVVKAPYNTIASVLVVAGGGGGSNSTALTQTQRDGQLNGGTGGNGSVGTGGSGGSGSTTGTRGGGGFSSNGSSGIAFVNGGTLVGNAGFGGGGAGSGTATGGGGGGYSGGGDGGGGGGSIINGAITTITNSQSGTAINTAGQVILSW